MGWGGRWEGGSKGSGHTYTCGWFMLMFDRKQQNSVKQLSFNYKINSLKEIMKTPLRRWITNLNIQRIEFGACLCYHRGTRSLATNDLCSLKKWEEKYSFGGFVMKS